MQTPTSEEGPELEVSPPMSRRTLELLVYLARHQPRLAREIPFQLVPGPSTDQMPVVEVCNLHPHFTSTSRGMPLEHFSAVASDICIDAGFRAIVMRHSSCQSKHDAVRPTFPD